MKLSVTIALTALVLHKRIDQIEFIFSFLTVKCLLINHNKFISHDLQVYFDVIKKCFKYPHHMYAHYLMYFTSILRYIFFIYSLMLKTEFSDYDTQSVL